MTTFKDFIGMKDLKLWDGVLRTFSRRTSTGGSLTQNKLGSVVDILEVYGGGDTYTDATLLAAISAIGTNPVTILFQPGTWVIANDVTIPPTMSIMVPQGATISVSSGKTLTISGNIIAGSYVIFDGAGTIAGSPILTFKDSYWFSGTVTDSTTPTYKAITEGAVTATSVSSDTINEKTAAAGVTIDGVKLKDSQPYCDVINEKTAATGVTIDGCLIKDGVAASATAATTATTATQVTDGTNNIRTKIISIGDWNMDTTGSVSVAHGLTASKIRRVTATIRDDSDTAYSPIYGADSASTSLDGNAVVSGANVSITRITGGRFDGINYDSISFNRGWIVIDYVE